MNVDFADDAGGFRIRLPENDATVRISEFPLLRNVTVRLKGGQPELATQFEQAMTNTLARTSAETSPMAVCMMLLATAMLVAPGTMMVQSMPQIVRLIGDMMK